MIKLQPNPTFKFTVEFAVPGSTEPARFTLIGRHQGQAALAAWAEKAKDLDGKDAAFLGQVVAGWEGVQGEDGEVPFSADNFARLIDAYPGAGLQIFTAYVRELSAGRGKN